MSVCPKCIGDITWPTRTLKILKQDDDNYLDRNQRLEKVVTNKQLMLAVEIEEERRARLEKQ